MSVQDASNNNIPGDVSGNTLLKESVTEKEEGHDKSKKDSFYSQIAGLMRDREETLRNKERLSQLSELMSEKLVEQEEEMRRKREQQQIDNKKHSIKLELEYLEIENMKMHTYLQTLIKKHELELLYLQEVCTQKKKVTDLSNNNPDMNFDEVESYDDYYTRQLEKVSTSSANFLFSMNETMQRNAKDYSAIQPVHSNGSDPKNYEFSLSRNMTNRNIDQNQTQQQTTSKNNVTSNSGSNPGNRPPVPDTASLLKSAGDLISVNRSNTTGKIDLAGDLSAAVAKRRQSIQPDSDWES
jgi:hypothetical protein